MRVEEDSSMSTKKMHLVFVCRVFFEELRVAANRAEATRAISMDQLFDLQMPMVRMLF